MKVFFYSSGGVEFRAPIVQLLIKLFSSAFIAIRVLGKLLLLFSNENVALNFQYLFLYLYHFNIIYRFIYIFNFLVFHKF
ncbi:hypothetical protein GLOIN_2v1674042 [Rhizophagus irregularis DAOM 181602=DAOM 197198]|uniref:Uncharacterized protein n=1 Tax=Rhizophagus irregularis (strain DAOM 181602 / DAOM 197198 / MUCL 43194) TaxID=747089 RepID=A0A2P4PGP9_RHIID|nr:hypothetical protein GLOIN_2v1674042 [Rhizophagus irregularis DAOM 181602=DAOM 197198]POG64562.1 hypothetical protein GLOIN_2v1674042 [Rhizophagus irregularis DAOM 181602=DAOM 197198]GET51589.1 hypothetical protein GLOIN_2v1674042 [Rhizophagus irregularis DAOM 181602=DAOM 197198]|eukprot:XP_025171428.1 hypothetical protein GLOIN_2v1674042 [Rhizophagus irregularis DAOM 181602=DAOM 197198]